MKTMKTMKTRPNKTILKKTPTSVKFNISFLKIWV